MPNVYEGGDYVSDCYPSHYQPNNLGNVHTQKLIPIVIGVMR